MEHKELKRQPVQLPLPGLGNVVKSQIPRQVVVGVDPGFANMGIVVLTQSEAGVYATDSALVRTEKETKKRLQAVRVANDDMRRVQEMQRGLCTMIEKYNPCAVCVETYSPFRAAGGNAWKCALVYGMVLGIVGMYPDLVLLPFLPLDLKRNFTLRKSASKDEVGEALFQRVGGLRAMVEDYPKTVREHITDAAGHALLGFHEVARMRSLLGVSNG